MFFIVAERKTRYNKQVMIQKEVYQMVKLKKRVTALAIAGTLAAVSMTGCGSLNTNETVATVGDEKITLGVANFYARLQNTERILNLYM